jgi:hypothetical protein
MVPPIDPRKKTLRADIMTNLFMKSPGGGDVAPDRRHGVRSSGRFPRREPIACEHFRQNRERVGDPVRVTRWKASQVTFRKGPIK